MCAFRDNYGTFYATESPEEDTTFFHIFTSSSYGGPGAESSYPHAGSVTYTFYSSITSFELTHETLELLLAFFFSYGSMGDYVGGFSSIPLVVRGASCVWFVMSSFLFFIRSVFFSMDHRVVVGVFPYALVFRGVFQAIFAYRVVVPSRVFGSGVVSSSRPYYRLSR